MAGFTQLTDEQENQLLNPNAVSSPPQIEEEKEDDDVLTGFTQLTEEQALALTDGPPPQTKASIVTGKQH